MRYALIDPQDAQEPRYRLIRDEAEAEPNEVVMEEEPPPGWVWDGARSQLREPTEAERLEEAKARKVEDFARRAIDELAPLFTEGRGEHELMFLLAAHVRQICEAVGVQPDARLPEVERVGKKALAKRDEVEAATTPEELEEIGWTQ
jgi:hypothetical protein